MRLKETLLTSLLLVPLSGTSVWAKERGNHDAFLASQQSRSLSVTETDLQSRGARVEHVESRLGVPTVLWSAQGDAERAGLLAGQSPEQAARAHLQRFADVYRLGREELSSAELHSVHKQDFGPVISRFQQRVGGIEVFRSGLNVVMDRNNDLVAITGFMAPREAVSATRRAAGKDFRLGAADAIARAFTDLTDTAISARSLVGTSSKGEYAHFAFEPGVSTVMPHAMATPARARKVYFMMPDGLLPAWYVELNVGSKGSQDADYYSYVVSAVDGALLFRNDLTVADSFTYKVWADPVSFIPFDGPHGTVATPHPTGVPDSYQAPFIPANMITLPNAPFSRNDPWLPPNATQTTGNNVDAYADLAAPDGFQPDRDLRPSVTSPGVFDYTYDVTRAPGFSQNQIKAATAHLFYVNNFLHDWYYDAGFDEAAGNAQASNYGRGGIEGDSLKAEAQDYGGRNNANMSTPSDGARPRMQMYVFSGVPTLLITAPASLAGTVDSGSASFGAQEFEIAGDVLILDPTGATDGCAAFPEETFAGKIALIDRGGCTFAIKAKNAQLAGAIGTIIANNGAGPAPGLGGTDATVLIPTMSISLDTANAWKAEVANNGSTVSVEMKRTPNLDRDGTLDNAIVAHEWGHYISNRLVGNSNGLTNNQGRSMGEGWADFHALLMMVRDEDRNSPGNDQFQGVYAMAGYTQSGGANSGHYYGIRRLPLSTDFNKNALTFKHFANGNPLPNTHPIDTGTINGRGNSQVHNGGEVWSTMLWECYASLLNAHPFQEAQDRMKQYLVAGYKLTPNAPTLLEARDALLAAAAASDPADFARFAQAFAKRGAGFGAKAADRHAVDHVGVVESFVSGNNLEVVSIRLDDSAIGCDQDEVLDVGETGLLQVTVRNTGAGALASFNATVSASNATATLSFPSGNTMSFPALQPQATATRSVLVEMTAVTGAEPRAGLTLTFDEPSLPAQAATVTYDGRVHYDEMLGASASDSFESSMSAWTSSLIDRSPGWKLTQGYIHVPDLAVVSDVVLTSPWLKVNPSGNFTMSFKYRYSLEGTVSGSGLGAPFYDGVVVEISTDGTQWLALYEDLGIDPGYVAFLALGDNPLSDRAAFTGMSATFPGWETANVNLGDAFAGKDVRVRFRIGTDSAAGAYGFDLDDVQFTNVANAPFSAQQAEESNGLTCNRRPVADAGQPTTTVQEFLSENGTMTRQTVTLNGSGSFDPDGQALNYTWTQVAGPAVTLTGADTAMPSFLADVPADTVYVFQLVVDDGEDSSQPKAVEVLVQNVNRAPVAVANAPASIAERSVSTITLDASGSTDEDGEALSYQWTQISGDVTVDLSDATAQMPTFPVPEVAADTQLTFQLVVNDGHASSAPVTLAVTVTNVDRAPVANAGADREVNARETVTLEGSGTDPDGDAVSYTWTVVDAPTGTTLENADTATPSFTAPDVRTVTPAALVFQLITRANGVDSEPDTVTITVNRANRHPVGKGPAHFEEAEGTAVTLDASESEDPDGDTLTYTWTQTGGPLVTLTGQGTAQLKFTTPEVPADTIMTFTLVVKDADELASDPVPVSLKVLHVNKAPRSVPRKTAGGISERQVTLDASGSTDPDGDALTYQWEQVKGPSVQLSSATAESVTFQAPKTESSSTSLEFKLTVTDAHGATASANVEVLVFADSVSDSGGCSSSGASSGGWMLLALVAGVLLTRRRELRRG